MRNKIENPASGIAVTINELIALRASIVSHPRADKLKWLKNPGQKMSRMRGRGLEFEANREYQPGDDIRSMAWRVTARSLKPHIKIYNEEKERPVWLALDLSPSLYFGTRCMFKSVGSIKQAAFLGWSHLLKHERIGAMIASERKMEIFKPKACEQDFLTILNALAQHSRLHPEFNENNYLLTLLKTLQHQARAGNLIFIISDFFQFDSDIQKLIFHISQRAQVVLTFVYDPFEAEAPPPHQYLLTNGKQRAVFDMENKQARAQYQQQFQQKLATLTDFSRKYNIPLQILRTDQPEGFVK